MRGFAWNWMSWAAIIALLAGEARMNAAEEHKAEQLLAESRPLVIAHRGYSGIAPENTMPAFELAIAAGSDLVELDYHHSRDGVPVVMHDYDLDRTTEADEKWGGSKIRVDARTAAEVLELDAGAWKQSWFTGTKVPGLAEALDLIQRGSVTLIERKAGDAKTCVELLRAKKLLNQVVVQAFDWDYLRDYHALEPRQILGALGPPSTFGGKKVPPEEKPLSARWNDEVKKLGAKLVVWNREVSAEAVKDAHSKGLKVWVYTINDPALAAELLARGIDGIITDHPPLIWKAMALRQK